MPDLLTPESLREGLAALTAPLRGQLEQLEITIATKETELGNLRAMRTELKTALRSIDPAFAAELKASRRANGAKGTSYAIAKTTRDAIVRWLAEHASEWPRGITGTELARHVPYSDGHVAKAIKVLHEDGVLRLDHRGTGGSKWYKLAA